jgi:hypothetical protein
MAVHYFHCTNGIDALFDQVGRDVYADDLVPQAASRARSLMRGLPAYEGWAAWTVCIHDEFGHMVRIVPFPAAELPWFETPAPFPARTPPAADALHA